MRCALGHNFGAQLQFIDMLGSFSDVSVENRLFLLTDVATVVVMPVNTIIMQGLHIANPQLAWFVHGSSLALCASRRSLLIDDLKIRDVHIYREAALFALGAPLTKGTSVPEATLPVRTCVAVVEWHFLC